MTYSLSRSLASNTRQRIRVSLARRMRPASAAWRWMPPHTARQAGAIAIILTLLYILTTYGLQATLNYPEALAEPASLAYPLVARAGVWSSLAFVGLILCGGLLIALARGLPRNPAQRGRVRLALVGSIAGGAWLIGASLGLVLLALWGSTNPTATPALAAIDLILLEIVAPLLLAFWTAALARQLRAHPALGLASAIGLLLIALRSLIWGFNALAPIESGIYGSAGLLAILAVVGESLWLVWLLLLGFWLMRNPDLPAGAPTPTPRDTRRNGAPA